MSRSWSFAISLSFALIVAAAPVRGQDVQTEMERVHDLAKEMFGMMERYQPPENPCPEPCPCAQKCPGGSTCVNLTGTPNQKLVGRAWYWGWTLRNLPASSPTRACARQYLLDTINLQQTHGHYSLDDTGGEELTIGHGQIWLAGMAAAYLFALTNGPTYGIGNPPDTAMLDAVRKWWTDEKYLWDQIANGGAQVRVPGARFDGIPVDGSWAYRERIYTLLKGQVPSGISNWPNDKYYTGGWIFDELRRRGQSPTLAVSQPAYTPSVRLFDRLCLYRRGADFLYYFPRMTKVLAPLFWVRQEGGTMTYAPLVSGTPTNPPAGVKPANFPGATTISLSAIDPGALSCPSPDALQ